jgi:hypothetical protein
MFWIALSALIMSLTGAGDDTYVIRKFIEEARDAVDTHVKDEARRKAANQTLDRTAQAFEKHRQRVGKISACVERLDRTYAAARADYERCLVDVTPAWDAAAEDLIVLERTFHEQVSPAELAAIRRAAEPD